MRFRARGIPGDASMEGVSTKDRIVRRLYQPFDSPPSPEPAMSNPPGSLRGLLAGAGAEVVDCSIDTLSMTIIGLIGQRGWNRVVSVRRNRVGHPSVLGDDPPLSDTEIRSLEAVVTESAVAIEESGVIVLDHSPGQGRQELTLACDAHVCVVEEIDVVADVAEAVRIVDWSGPSTWIGPGRQLPDLGSDPVDERPGPDTMIVILVGSSAS